MYTEKRKKKIRIEIECKPNEEIWKIRTIFNDRQIEVKHSNEEILSKWYAFRVEKGHTEN